MTPSKKLGNQNAAKQASVKEFFKKWIQDHRSHNGKTQVAQQYHLHPQWTRLANLNENQWNHHPEAAVATSFMVDFKKDFQKVRNIFFTCNCFRKPES